MDKFSEFSSLFDVLEASLGTLSAYFVTEIAIGRLRGCRRQFLQEIDACFVIGHRKLIVLCLSLSSNCSFVGFEA